MPNWDDGRFELGLCLLSGQEVKLSPAAEEVALFFAQMLDHEYTTKEVFRNNFFKDWRKVQVRRDWRWRGREGRGDRREWKQMR